MWSTHTNYQLPTQLGNVDQPQYKHKPIISFFSFLEEAVGSAVKSGKQQRNQRKISRNKDIAQQKLILEIVWERESAGEWDDGSLCESGKAEENAGKPEGEAMASCGRSANMPSEGGTIAREMK
jgi:hypothetical protein